MLLLTSFGMRATSQEQSLEISPDSASAPSISVASHKSQIETSDPASVAPWIFLKNLVSDQKAIWSSPFKARIEDLHWLVPFAGLTVGLVNADAELSSRITGTGTLTKHSSTISNVGMVFAVGGTSGLYVLGRLRNDDHQQETGIIAGEATLNSLLIVESLKAISRRQRPTDGAGQGKSGASTVSKSSLSALHATLAWSAASVLSHEYPGVLTQALAYGLATGVSVARVTGKDHFPSDVVVGSAVGWLVGRQVYAAHHDPEIPGGGYGTFERGNESNASRSRSSAYVPMDSWVYPSMDRLIALGAVQSSLVGLRPWTRAECARLLEEAASVVEDSSSGHDEVT